MEGQGVSNITYDGSTRTLKFHVRIRGGHGIAMVRQLIHHFDYLLSDCIDSVQLCLHVALASEFILLIVWKLKQSIYAAAFAY